eukprot:m.76201 g.76201  ORF g.76201 m.76201 type:complete len:1120 (+) comp8509_c0_seq2:84-3443(+)
MILQPTKPLSVFSMGRVVVSVATLVVMIMIISPPSTAVALDEPSSIVISADVHPSIEAVVSNAILDSNDLRAIRFATQDELNIALFDLVTASFLVTAPLQAGCLNFFTSLRPLYILNSSFVPSESPSIIYTTAPDGNHTSFGSNGPRVAIAMEITGVNVEAIVGWILRTYDSVVNLRQVIHAPLSTLIEFAANGYLDIIIGPSSSMLDNFHGIQLFSAAQATFTFEEKQDIILYSLPWTTPNDLERLHASLSLNHWSTFFDTGKVIEIMHDSEYSTGNMLSMEACVTSTNLLPNKLTCPPGSHFIGETYGRLNCAVQGLPCPSVEAGHCYCDPCFYGDECSVGVVKGQEESQAILVGYQRGLPFIGLCERGKICDSLRFLDEFSIFAACHGQDVSLLEVIVEFEYVDLPKDHVNRTQRFVVSDIPYEHILALTTTPAFVSNIEVFLYINGNLHTSSPFKVAVQTSPCSNARKERDIQGVCICKGGYAKSGYDCIPNSAIIARVVVPIVCVVFLITLILIAVSRQSRDNHWLHKMDHIEIHEGDDLGQAFKGGSVLKGYFKGLPVELWPVAEPGKTRSPQGGERIASNNGLNEMGTRFISDMRILVGMQHKNVCSVIGAIADSRTESYIILEHCENGSLDNLLHKTSVPLDSDMRLSLVKDIASGINFLHTAKPPIIHDNISPETIFIDANFRAKLGEYHEFIRRKEYNGGHRKIYLAPERLLGESMTKKCDVYSFAMVALEVLQNERPYEALNQQEAIQQAMNCAMRRRRLDTSLVPTSLYNILQQSWAVLPSARPSMSHVYDAAASISSLGSAFLDRLQDRHRQEQQIHDVFPRHIANMVEAGEKVKPERLDSVTLCMARIFNFEEVTRDLSLTLKTKLLNRLFEQLDTLCDQYDLFKVETVGDLYICAGNLGHLQKDHAARIARFAAEAMEICNGIPLVESSIPLDDDELDAISDSSSSDSEDGETALLLNNDSDDRYVEMMFGIHTGSVTTHVIGEKNPKYSLFGTTLNIASKIQMQSEPGYIHVSSTAYEMIIDQDETLECFFFDRGVRYINKFGDMTTYFLLRSGQKPPKLERTKKTDKKRWQLQKKNMKKMALFQSKRRASILRKSGKGEVSK